jgi:hypothetical protein
MFPRGWNGKPPPGTPLNWGHPLAHGLLGAWLCDDGGGLMRDRTGRGSDVPMFAGGVMVPSVGGVGLRSDASDKGALLTPLPEVLRPTVEVSIVWFGISLGAASATSSTLVGTWYNAAGSSPFTPYLLTRSADGTTQFLTDGGGSFNSLNLAGDITLGVVSQVAGTYRSGVKTLYMNGQSRASNAATGALTYSATSELTFNSASGTNRNANVVTLATYIYNRVLSAVEIAALYAQPYQMFAPLVWRRYLVLQELAAARQRTLMGVGL